MDTEEMSRLWSAMQAHYRPSASYLATVVLIESREPSRTALPVLTRGAPVPGEDRDQGVVVEPSLLPPFPTIWGIDPPLPADPAAVLGDTVTLRGHHLSGTGVEVSFEHRLLEEPHVVAVGANGRDDAIDVALPDPVAVPSAATDWPAGVYTVTATLTGADLVERTTNVAAMLLAPEPQPVAPGDITRDPASRSVTVELGVQPEVRPAQRAQLSLGSATATARPLAGPGPSATLTFELGDVPPGAQWLRLTVDGVESLLLDRAQTPPVFDPSQSVVVPA
jgi:hypothetical protein